MHSIAPKLVLIAVLALAASAAGCTITPKGSDIAQQETISKANTAAETARKAAAIARDAAEIARNLPSSKLEVLSITFGTAAQRAQQKGKLSYVGEALNGKANGYGRVFIIEPGVLEGKYYLEGEFRNHLPHGYAVQYSISSYGSYEGEWQEGKHFGFGTSVLGDENSKQYRGDRFHGEYRDDVRHGYGIYYKVNGEAHYGYWEGGHEPDAMRYAIRKGVRAPNIEYLNITKTEYDRLRDKEKSDTVTSDVSSAIEVETEAPIDDSPIETKLEKLKNLLDKGLITDEDAEIKRAKLLNNL